MPTFFLVAFKNLSLWLFSCKLIMVCLDIVFFCFMCLVCVTIIDFTSFFFKKAIITEIFLLPPFFWDFNYMYIRPLNPQVLPSQFIFPVGFFSSIFFFHLSVCIDVPLILVAFSYVVNCKISDIFEF